MFGFFYRRFQLLVPSCSIAVDSGLQYPHCFRIITSFSSLGSKTDKRQDLSFTISYLIDTFGFSPEVALSLSKKRNVHFKSPEKPNSVIQTFKDYGFCDTHVSGMVKQLPTILSCKAEQTLVPKLEFFNSIGISGTTLSKVLYMNPALLRFSLENSLRPFYDITKALRIPRKKLPQFFRDYRRMDYKKMCIVAGNTSILRAHGVPDFKLRLWMSSNFNALLLDSEEVEENVNKVMSMGFRPLSATFMKALYVISRMDALKWQEKMELYRKWGVTEDAVLSAFRKSPLFMILDEKILSSKMDYYVNTMGLLPSEVVGCPAILSFSLEKRIIPRCSVVRLLQLQGLAIKFSNITILQRTEQWFLENFVIKYQEQVPEVLSYKGESGCTNLA